MILLTILGIIFATCFGLLAIAAIICGAGFAIVFGDLIVFVIVMIFIVKLIKKLKKKK